MIRKLVPKSLKLQWQLFKRARSDKQSGFYKNLGAHKGNTSSFHHKVSVTQPIKNNAGAINKIHNIKLSYQQMEHLIIQSGEYFSYWHVVPAPIAKNGFKKGRNLLAGKLQEDYGGGLCQLSGMLYIAALKAGLEITERHHHSIDIYTEETRYTPLGSDATVVYGYKDLRFTNNLNQAISIELEFKENSLTLHLISDQPFVEQEISWNLVSQTDFKVVETRNSNGEVLGVSRYRV
ncbi:vancomycin resistance protein VanW [Nonlabens dokdonensis]|jgi:vancomycin resistance protein VanW|uniref:Vancomycin resistance protein VanW n=2 Tax=Nonlabens dokdonensis TaxID=328515 RepID=A0ABX5PYT8_9FLAO|nr:VanW family protein [Nonlabens dokdonensis]AGC77384.1 putative vancomycin B-type resistance protein [Nonlabens dokdonensis DSW-6]PZX40910.1 vancomycin resistance protein VanW [Nonlabens dokdonensis]